jgi:hypothetical protein
MTMIPMPSDAITVTQRTTFCDIVHTPSSEQTASTRAGGRSVDETPGL